MIKKAAQADQGYVPPPPKDGPMIKPPVGMPNVRTFPISSHAPPPSMSFPDIASAPKEESAAAEGEGATPDAAEEIDDGLTPEQRRKI